jgi:hypothetical protein
VALEFVATPVSPRCRGAVLAACLCAGQTLAALVILLAACEATPGKVVGEGGGHRVLWVGSEREFRTPSAAAAAAQDGDHIVIDPGDYWDCAVWRANRLLIEGRGEQPHLRDVSCEGKGIWVIKGNDTTIASMRFSGAAVPGRNGAGILLQGVNLEVRDSWFHDNENGILAGSAPHSSIGISNSRFERNGKCEPNCAHGIYIGRIGWLRVRNSIFREQRIGHHIKSRALVTEVSDTVIEDGAEGTASYAINLPDGGTALIRHNVIQKGPRTDNPSTVIAIGEEGARNPGVFYLIEDNTVRSDVAQPVIFVRNRSETPALLRGNRLEGNLRPLEGPGYMR